MKTEQHQNEQNEQKTPEILSDEIKNSAATSYLFIFAPFSYFLQKDSDFIHFHAKQACILLIAFLVLWSAGNIFSFFRYLTIPVIFGAIIGFINAIQGEKYELPLVKEVLKEGFSFQKIVRGFIRAGKILAHVLLGFFPKKTGDTILKKLQIDPNQELIQRVENIEKILLQEKFFKPSDSIPLKQVEKNTTEYFETILQKLRKYDEKLVIQHEETFLEISGLFGSVILGGIKKENTEYFCYALSKDFFVSPEHSNEFGGFILGTEKIGTSFLLKQKHK